MDNRHGRVTACEHLVGWNKRRIGIGQLGVCGNVHLLGNSGPHGRSAVGMCVCAGSSVVVALTFDARHHPGIYYILAALSHHTTRRTSSRSTSKYTSSAVLSYVQLYRQLYSEYTCDNTRAPVLNANLSREHGRNATNRTGWLCTQ